MGTADTLAHVSHDRTRDVRHHADPAEDAPIRDERPDDRPLAFLLGAPTASGKSAVALRLAERYGFEIVSADAMQVYRGLDIGTAKPSAEDRARVPHHAIDLADPNEPFSVAAWVRAAEAAIHDAHARGRSCLVVGGSGFYLHALAEGLPTTPAADPAAQEPYWEAIRAHGLDPLLERLRNAAPLDAERAERNPRRIVRMLEVLDRTGWPPSAFPPRAPRVAVDRTWLLPPLDLLDARIAERARAMLDGGLIEEAGALAGTALATARQAIGYAEAAQVARGETDRDEALRRIVVATRRYARRQRTWFRKHPAERRIEALATDAESSLAAWLERAA